MSKVKVLMVVEVEVGPGETAQSRLDAFREAVLPTENYGVTLYRATPEDVGGLADRVVMAFDEEEARGEVAIARGCYGPSVWVNGTDLGWVDLFPPTEGGSPQLILDHRSREDPGAKVVIEPGRLTLIVSREATALRQAHPQGIHGDWDDVVVIRTDEKEGPAE